MFTREDIMEKESKVREKYDEVIKKYPHLQEFEEEARVYMQEAFGRAVTDYEVQQQIIDLYEKNCDINMNKYTFHISKGYLCLKRRE